VVVLRLFRENIGRMTVRSGEVGRTRSRTDHLVCFWLSNFLRIAFYVRARLSENKGDCGIASGRRGRCF
jgi:hypothetical protein